MKYLIEECKIQPTVNELSYAITNTIDVIKYFIEECKINFTDQGSTCYTFAIEIPKNIAIEHRVGFDPTKKISSRDWQSLEQSLLNAPSSFGLQPWRFVTISDMDLRKKLLPHSWNQPQVVDASHLVVLAARTSVDPEYVDSFIKRICAAVSALITRTFSRVADGV